MRSRSTTQWQMLLLVFGRNVGAHQDGHQSGFTIQNSIKFGKSFLRTEYFTCENCTELNLGENLCTHSSFNILNSGLGLNWTVWQWKLPAIAKKTEINLKDTMEVWYRKMIPVKASDEIPFFFPCPYCIQSIQRFQNMRINGTTTNRQAKAMGLRLSAPE